MLAHMMRAARLKGSLSYRATYTNTTDLTTYSFTNCDIGGLNAPLRRVVVVVQATATVARTVSSVTVGGASASLSSGTNPSTLNVAAFYSVEVASGTTATIDVTFSGSVSNCTISVYAIYSLDSMVPQFVISATTETTATSRTLTNIVARDSIWLAAITYKDAATAATTWTNIIEYYDDVVETRSRSNAGLQYAVASPTYAITAATGVSRTARLSVASFYG